MVTDYALSEALLRESREKRELLGLQARLTTDQVRAAKELGRVQERGHAMNALRSCCPAGQRRCSLPQREAGAPPAQVISAAAAVMQSTIGHLEARYGSAHAYCRAIGLSAAELSAIKRNLTDPALAVPTTPAPPACGAGGSKEGREGSELGGEGVS